jgi:hypothetical protein
VITPSQRSEDNEARSQRSELAGRTLDISLRLLAEEGREPRSDDNNEVIDI